MESLLFACVILKHIQVHVNRSLKILNSTKATLKKKRHKKEMDREYSRDRETGCIQYGSLPPDRLDKIYLHSSAITKLPLHLPSSHHHHHPPFLSWTNKSDTVLTVETLRLRLRDTGNTSKKVNPGIGDF